MTDLNGADSPSPADTFVFLDEREDRISWGGFMVDMKGYGGQPALYTLLEDVPGMYHNGAGSFSFADGHVALKRWVDPRTTPPLLSQQLVSTSIACPRNPDVAWLQQHATRPKQ